VTHPLRTRPFLQLPSFRKRRRVHLLFPHVVIRAYYEEFSNPKQMAARFNLSVNTLKGRIRREGWSRRRTVWIG
jgi:hypothetical protein